MLHWLFPCNDLASGICALLDDKVCQYISDCTDEVDVAEVYAEEPIFIDVSDRDDDDSDYDAEKEDANAESSKEDKANDGKEAEHTWALRECM